MTPVVVGLLTSAAIAAIGWRIRALTAGGALGAVVVGTVVYALGGVGAAVVLVAFFVSSSALSRLGGDRGAAVVAKGGSRDISQVLANGLVPAAMSVVGAVLAPTLADLWPAYVGAVGAATADTWSTEIGMRSKRSPRTILGGRTVAPGTSGGVTPLGLAGALAGGLAIGALGVAVALLDPAGRGTPALATLAAGIVGGLAGSLGDSLLGTGLQRVNWCPACGVETEQAVHRCGTPTVYRRGLRWLDNDGVNLIATAIGAAAGLLLSDISQ